MAEPMPEPVIASRIVSENHSQQHQDGILVDNRECFEGGENQYKLQLLKKNELHRTARTKIYHESEMKARSQLIHAAFFGRKISLYAVVFNFAFVLRVFVFCLALVFCESWTFPHQVLLILVTSMLTFGSALLAGSELWVENKIRYQYNFNESIIIAAIMFHYWFSEHVEDFELRQDIGDAFIAMIIITVCVNFGFTVL